MTIEAAEILEELKAEMARQHSPWAGRRSAAAYCDCSTRTIDDAANAGKFKRYWRGSDPIFKKSELDQWLEGKAKDKEIAHYRKTGRPIETKPA